MAQPIDDEPASIEVEYDGGVPTFTLRRNVRRTEDGWAFEAVSFSAPYDPMRVALDFDELFDLHTRLER